MANCHVMVDLETLGLQASSVVRSIGAVAFDDNGIFNTFYTVLEMETQIDRGRVIDPSTVLWWMTQSDRARTDFVAPMRVPQPVSEGLSAFTQFVTNHLSGTGGVWGNGAAFDNVVLRSLYRDYNRPVPWGYRRDYCYRTLFAMPSAQRPEVEIERAGTHHNALDDASYQALRLIKLNQLMQKGIL